MRMYQWLLSMVYCSILAYANTPITEQEFSYCSNGHCGLLSAQYFQRQKNFPIDLNYVCKNDNHYALTFDDGPSANWSTLLEILSRHNVVATFFVVGQNLSSSENKELVLRAFLEGHQISNHTFTHPSLLDLDSQQIFSELLMTKDAILSIIGDSPKNRLDSGIIRPPFGKIDPRIQGIVNELGFVSVRWNSDRYDWQISPENGHIVVERIRQHLNFLLEQNAHTNFNKSVIDLNHDHSLATLSVLDDTLPMIKQAGYTFVSLSECLGIQ